MRGGERAYLTETLKSDRIDHVARGVEVTKMSEVAPLSPSMQLRSCQ